MPIISDILNDLQRTQEPAVKTASTAGMDPVSAAAAELNASLAQLNLTKQASAQPQAPQQSATAAIEKMAHDLAAADEQRQLKMAQLHGAAIFDGFLARANQYASVAPQTKVASVAPVSNGESVKIAAQLGYSEAENAINRIVSTEKTAQYHMMKTAAEEHAAGVHDAMQKIAEVTDECFQRGYAQMEMIANALRG